MYTSDPVPRQAGGPPPVMNTPSNTPLRDFLRRGGPTVQDGYLVIPRRLAENMPLAWQNALVQIVAEFQQAYAQLPWPEYRVVPSRRERLTDLDEEQLAEVGCIMEIDADGAVVYRERTGKVIQNPELTEVLVSCLDPLPPEQSNANEDTPPRGFPVPPVQQPTNWA